MARIIISIKQKTPLAEARINLTWCRDRLAAETPTSTAPRTATGKANAGGRKRPVPGGTFSNRPRRART